MSTQELLLQNQVMIMEALIALTSTSNYTLKGKVVEHLIDQVKETEQRIEDSKAARASIR